MKWFSVEREDIPSITFFKLELPALEVLDFDFSADEQCQIFVDGQFVAEGTERDAKSHWHKQHVSIRLAPRPHALVARLLVFGKAITAHAQLSVKPGFWCSLDGDWQQLTDMDIHARQTWPDWGVYPNMTLNASAHWKYIQGEGDGWKNATTHEDDRQLFDAEFPSMLGMDVLAYRRGEHQIVFDDYACVWPIYEVSGTGTIDIRWAETGYINGVFSRHTLKGNKGRRDGKYIFADSSSFKVDGHAVIVDWQYRAGRIMDYKTTGTVQLRNVRFINHGYQYDYRSCVKDNPIFKTGLLKMAKRTLECCTHDTFMDCPHYERMMYIGDARIEALCAYAVADDSAMARKALRCLASSQIENGNILSRYPAKIDQYIPAFSVIFILMLHDFACWQDDVSFVDSLIPCAERIAGYLLKHKKDDGLYYPEGWNFIDWTWPQHGVPYGSECGTNSPLNLFTLLAFRKLAALERYAEHVEKAEYFDTVSAELEKAIWNKFLIPDKGLLADDLEKRYVSEHSQILALLFKRDERMIEALHHPENFLTTCGIYFNHYYFEACRIHGLKDLFDARMEYYAQLEELGLKTMPEDFISPRSDCHAWSSHILFHFMCMNGMASPRRILN